MKGAERLATLLSHASAVRGTHATGVSYVMDGTINIDKAPESAYKFKIAVPTDTITVMGHTRYTTQGNEKYNYNNHPFRGTTKKYGSFALAHNGIIQNDRGLKSTYDLPKTKVETDTYVAVQLIEKYCREGGAFGLEAMKYMADKVYGMFTFTVLDENNKLYIVKGDSPISILHFKNIGLYIYASTRQILMEAIMGSSIGDSVMEDFLPDKGRGDIELLEPKEGEIWCINPDGTVEKGTFTPFTYSGYQVGYKGHRSKYLVDSYDDRGWDWDNWSTTSNAEPATTVVDYSSTYKNILYQVAEGEGYSKQEVDLVLEFGYDTLEIEDALYDKAFEEMLNEVKSYCMKTINQEVE